MLLALLMLWIRHPSLLRFCSMSMPRGAFCERVPVHKQTLCCDMLNLAYGLLWQHARGCFAPLLCLPRSSTSVTSNLGSEATCRTAKMIVAVFAWLCRDVRIKHAPRYHVEMMACCCAWLLLTISTSSHTSTPDPTAQSNATACGAPPNAYNYASSSVGGQCPMLGRVGMANGFPTHLSSLSHSSTFLAHFLESSRAPWVTYGISSWKPVLSLLSFTYATLLAVNAVAYMSSAAMRPVLAAQLWPLLWTLRMGAKLLALVHACMRLAYGTASATAALPTTELVAAVCFGALADGLAPQAALTVGLSCPLPTLRFAPAADILL